MAITQEHELHARRRKRNAMLGLVLVGFVVMVFAITMVKLDNGGTVEGFDHAVRPGLVESND